jgi:hypothetical protein
MQRGLKACIVISLHAHHGAAHAASSAHLSHACTDDGILSSTIIFPHSSNVALRIISSSML